MKLLKKEKRTQKRSLGMFAWYPKKMKEEKKKKKRKYL